MELNLKANNVIFVKSWTEKWTRAKLGHQINQMEQGVDKAHYHICKSAQNCYELLCYDVWIQWCLTNYMKYVLLYFLEKWLGHEYLVLSFVPTTEFNSLYCNSKKKQKAKQKTLYIYEAKNIYNQDPLGWNLSISIATSFFYQELFGYFVK